MRTNLLSKFLFVTATFVALLSASSSVFAQVKIGTNPTTIGANNNLEVEASTTGRKTSIDKTTGQVTIQDGTEGAGKVFTSDANGGGSWQQLGAPAIAQLPKGKLYSASSTNLVYPFDNQTVAFANTQYLQGGITKVGNGLKVPISGYYMLTNVTGFQNTAGCTGNTATIATSVGTNVIGTATNPSLPTASNQVIKRGAGGWTANMAGMIYLNANDIIEVKLSSSISAPEAGCDTNVWYGEFSLTYMP